MAKISISRLTIRLLPLLVLGACATMQSGFNLPARHPEELPKGNPTCTACHEPASENFNYQRFDHNAFFMENHRKEAYQSEQVCRMCHTTSFCNDCHATRVELKPSVRHQTDNYRRMPHRGDYLTRHQIDARIDPTSCVRCHGNPKAARSCAPCHP